MDYLPASAVVCLRDKTTSDSACVLIRFNLWLCGCGQVLILRCVNVYHEVRGLWMRECTACAAEDGHACKLSLD